MNKDKRLRNIFLKHLELCVCHAKAAIAIIQIRLDLKAVEDKRPTGGFQWTITNNGCRRAVIQLYHDGKVKLYLQTMMTPLEMMLSVGVHGTYADIKDLSPFTSYLGDKSQFDVIIEKIKNYLL